MNIRRVISIGLAAVGLAMPGTGAEIEGVRFTDSLTVAGEPLVLRGTGLLRYRYVIKGYVAALYLGDPVGNAEAAPSVFDDAPKRLEIEYFWAIEPDGFAKATLEGISQNTDPATYEKLRTRIERLNGLYEKVEPGDRYAITYLPGVGTELALNGRRLGTIEGADFASAVFSIWLGERALDASLRNQLLSNI